MNEEHAKKELCQLEKSGKRNYDFWINAFNIWNNGKIILPITILDFLEIQSQSKKKYSLSSLYIAKCAMIFSIKKSFMRLKDYTTIHIFKTALSSFKIVREKTKVRESDLVTEEEMKTIEDKASKRNYHLVSFLYITGIRISELTNIRLSDCHEIKSGFIEILIYGKGKRKRHVLIPKTLFGGIRGHFVGVKYLFENQNFKQYTTRGLQDVIRRMGKRLLGRRIYPHLFRHTFITNQMKSNESVASIAEYVGNTPRIIFEHYFHDKVNHERMLSNVNIFEGKYRKVA